MAKKAGDIRSARSGQFTEVAPRKARTGWAMEFGARGLPYPDHLPDDVDVFRENRRFQQQTMAYTGTITTTGRSGAVRLESAFFKGHPEFAQRAKVRASVIGPGYVLLSVSELPAGYEDKDQPDPVVGAYLAFLERDMIEHPERIQPIDLKVLDELLQDVEPLRDDEELPADFEL